MKMLQRIEKEVCRMWDKFCYITWKLLPLKMENTLHWVISSGRAFCRNYQSRRPCISWQELVKVIVIFTLCLLFSVCSPSLAQLISIAICISYPFYKCSTMRPVIYLLSRDRAGGSPHARNCVYLTNINSSYTSKTTNIYYISNTRAVDDFSSFVRITPANVDLWNCSCFFSFLYPIFIDDLYRLMCLHDYIFLSCWCEGVFLKSPRRNKSF